METRTLDTSKRTILKPHELDAAGLPRRYWGLTRKDFLDRPYYDAMHDYIVSMDAVMREGRSLFVYGASGSGKSALAYYIARIYREYGIFTKFAVAKEVHGMIDDRVFDQRDELSMEEIWERTPLLVIDNLGIENVRPKQYSHVVGLFEARYLAARPTILTCAIEGMGELAEKVQYPKSFLDKMLTACTLIKCPRRG